MLCPVESEADRQNACRSVSDSVPSSHVLWQFRFGASLSFLGIMISQLLTTVVGTEWMLTVFGVCIIATRPYRDASPDCSD